MARPALRSFLCCLLLLSAAAADARPRPTTAPAMGRAAPRFRGRLQILSGAAVAIPAMADGSRKLVAYVPAEAELAIAVSGPVTLGLGGIGYLAPFALTTCSDTPSPRANALAAFATARFDFNNSRDGSWWSPWVALRGGVSGQAGVGGVGDPSDPSRCREQFAVGLYLSPRLGMDLWMGTVAVTFAVGYDYLPRGSGVSVQTGLTFRLF